MIIVKKVDSENETVTISNDGTLQDINLSEFLTTPEINDVVQPQQSANGETKLVVVSKEAIVSNNTQGKSKMAAGLLGIFLGGLGIHNFYLGYTVKGVIQLLICTFGWFLFIGWAAPLWGFIEGIIILCSKPGSDWHKDAQGTELTD